jgi:hypothetical protein
MTEYFTEIDFENAVTVSDEKHAHHTGWALDPDDRDCYALALHDEDGNVLAMAVYTFAHWMDVFDRLKSAHEMMTTGAGAPIRDAIKGGDDAS